MSQNAILRFIFRVPIIKMITYKGHGNITKTRIFLRDNESEVKL